MNKPKEVQEYFNSILSSIVKEKPVEMPPAYDAIVAQRERLARFDKDAIWDLLYDARKIYGNTDYDSFNEPEVRIEDVTPREFLRVMDGLMFLAEVYLGGE